MSSEIIRKFQEKIFLFYRCQGRDLPWRRTTDPYRILVAEIMLQQTQIEWYSTSVQTEFFPWISAPTAGGNFKRIT